MISEEDVPVEERLLTVAGIVSPRTLALVRDGLGCAPSVNGRVLFLMFSYADLPIGKEYAFACPDTRVQEAVPTRAIVSAVTQQWGRPFSEILHGWKTIALIEFPQGVPDMIDSLPVVEDWYSSASTVALLNEATLKACSRPAGNATVQHGIALTVGHLRRPRAGDRQGVSRMGMPHRRLLAPIAAAGFALCGGVFFGLFSCGGYLWHQRLFDVLLSVAVVVSVVAPPEQLRPPVRRGVFLVAVACTFVVIRAVASAFYPATPSSLAAFGRAVASGILDGPC